MTNILAPNWLIARELQKAVVKGSVFAKGRLLDAGCGDKPYARFFEGKVDSHIGIDMGSPLVTKDLDVFGFMHMLPFKDGSFSTILSTESLQYVPVPQKAMDEFYRVLKRGGVVILTTTQMWGITNPPHDYYRYTEYGLRYLAETSGFDIHLHSSLGGFWMRMGLKFCFFVHRFNKAKVLDLPIRLLLVLPQLFFLAMDKLFFTKKDVIDNFMVFVKPLADGG